MKTEQSKTELETWFDRAFSTLNIKQVRSHEWIINYLKWNGSKTSLPNAVKVVGCKYNMQDSFATENTLKSFSRCITTAW